MRPRRTASGAWQPTQSEPAAPFVSRCMRLFIATKTGSSLAYACMLPDHSRKASAWHGRQVFGSCSCAVVSMTGGSDFDGEHAASTTAPAKSGNAMPASHALGVLVLAIRPFFVARRTG